MPNLVCAFCFKADTIIEAVTLHGCWQEVSVGADPRNPDKFKVTSTGYREALWDSVDGEGFYCSECEARRDLLEELVTPQPFFECRACGFRGALSEEHPDSCPDQPERIDPPEIGAGQQKLST